MSTIKGKEIEEHDIIESYDYMLNDTESTSGSQLSTKIIAEETFSTVTTVETEDFEKVKEERDKYKKENQFLKENVEKLESLLKISQRMLEASDKLVQSLSNYNENIGIRSLNTTSTPASPASISLDSVAYTSSEQKEHFGSTGSNLIEKFVRIINN